MAIWFSQGEEGGECFWFSRFGFGLAVGGTGVQE